jgi:hypothetical protein
MSFSSLSDAVPTIPRSADPTQAMPGGAGAHISSRPDLV